MGVAGGAGALEALRESHNESQMKAVISTSVTPETSLWKLRVALGVLVPQPSLSWAPTPPCIILPSPWLHSDAPLASLFILYFLLPTLIALLSLLLPCLQAGLSNSPLRPHPGTPSHIMRQAPGN